MDDLLPAAEPLDHGWLVQLDGHTIAEFRTESVACKWADRNMPVRALVVEFRRDMLNVPHIIEGS